MRHLPITAPFALLLVLCGCSQNGDTSDTSSSDGNPLNIAEMKPAPRPPEVDRLAAFVGEWESTIQSKDPSGQMKTCKGSNTVTWGADKRVVLERMNVTMHDGKTVNGLCIWSYNPEKRHYEFVAYDSMGHSSGGTATYDEATRTWRMQSESRDPQSGQKLKEEGTAQFVDPNTMKWAHTTKSGGQTVMQMEGTSKRK